MPITDDGNEPHFIPKAVQQSGPAIVYGGSANGHIHSAYDLADICENGIDSRVIGRMIMGTLLTHFSDANNIAYPDVKQYIHSDNPELSKIRIALNTTWDSAAAGNTPSIIVTRQGTQSVPTVVGDYSGLDENGIRTYMRQTKTAYTIAIYAKGDGALEYLTDEVFFMLHAQFALLREDVPIHGATVGQVTGPKPAERGDHWLTSTITVEVDYEFGWFRCPSVATALEYNVGVSAS